jgi:hypothetical protein
MAISRSFSVKAGEDSFSKSLLRFQGYLKETQIVQLVYGLKRKKSTPLMKMLPMAEFLAELDLAGYIRKRD